MAIGGVGIGVASPISGGPGQGPNLPVVLSQIASQGPSQSTRLFPGNFIYDLFDRAPQALSGSISPTGNVWGLTGGDITLGRIILDPVKLDGSSSFVYTGLAAQPVYAYQSNGGVPITHAEAAFSFATGITNWNATNLGGQSMTLALESGFGTLTNLIHLNFGPTTWGLDIGANPASFVGVASGSYTILTDGTVYHIGMDINYVAQTVTINLPDGTSQTVSAPQIGPTGSLGIVPTWGFLEIGYASTYFYPQFKGIVISDGVSVGPNLRAFMQAAPMEEITLIKNSGAAAKKYIGSPGNPVTLSGGIGWYTIATASSLATFLMMGRVKVTKVSSSAQSVTSFFVAGQGGNEATGGPPGIQLQCGEYSSNYGTITQIRISNSTAAPYVQLDVYLYYANPVTLSVEFQGVFQPVPQPVVGATALSGFSTVALVGSPLADQGYNENASTSATTTLTAANITAGDKETTLNLTGAITVASNAALPTAISIVEVLAANNVFIGGWSATVPVTISFKLRIVNGGGSGSGVWTIVNASDSSWTLNGTMTIPAALGYRDFYCSLIGTGSTWAAAIQSLGTGTIGAI